MRKKYLLIILPAMLVTLCLLAGAGYAIHKALAGVLPDIWPRELQMNRKYYYTEEANQIVSERDYFIFYKNGTGDFHVCYRAPDDTSYNYTIHFRYERTSSGDITCTYKAVFFSDATHSADHVRVGGGENVIFRGEYTEWNEHLSFSKNKLSTCSPDGQIIYYQEENT